MRANALIILLAVAYTSINAQTNAGGALPSERKEPQATGASATQPLQGSVGTFRPGSGTVIVAELSKPLDAGKLKVGDQVECVLLQDLLYKGKVVVPHKAKAWGHVTEVVRATKGHPESRLGLVFDKIVLQGKKEVPFQYPAIIAAVAAPIRGTTVPTTKITDMPVQMERGRDTGGAMLDAVGANAQLAGANIASSTGAIGAADRGIIGIKDVRLDTSNPSCSVIVSKKGNVHLGYDLQLLLQITAAPKLR